MHEKGKQLKSQTLNKDANRVTRKSVSPPSRRDLAPCYSPSDKEDDAQADKGLPAHCFFPHHRHRCHRKDEICLLMSSKSARLDESPSNSESDTHSTHNFSRRPHRSKELRPKALGRVNIRFCDSLDYQNHRLADKLFKYGDHVAKSAAKWAPRLQIQVNSNIFDSFDPISVIRC